MGGTHPVQETAKGKAAAEGVWRRHRGQLIQAVMLMAVWLILSGNYDFLHILYGLISVAFVVWLNHRLSVLPLEGEERCGENTIIFSRLMLYLPWLLWQVVQSGIYVAGVVLKPNPRLAPSIVRFTSRQPGVMARVILGNSITLTPGTITLAINGDIFTVHALTADTAAGLVHGDMEHRVANLYRSGDPLDGARCYISPSDSRREL